MSDPVGQPVTRPWIVLDTWLRRASRLIAESAEALNAINVYPVPDSDTGSNLQLTFDGILAAVPAVTADSAGAIARAAIVSAHGNSGAIVAEMLASAVRRLAELGGPTQGGSRVAHVLRGTADAARRAVARPVEGTIVTVAEAAADAAEARADDHPGDALAAAEAARHAAGEALARTPEQLEALAAAGVVDAGGQAYVLLLDVLVESLHGPPARPLAVVEPAVASAARLAGAGLAPVEYEVMYALCGAPAAGREALREQLSALGHSVVMVGDQSVAQVHVHLRDAGAAVEAGLAAGQLSQIRITALPAEPQARTTARTVLCVVTGPGLAEAVAAAGGTPILAGDRDRTLIELTTAAEHCGGDVIILPNDPAGHGPADQLAVTVGGADRRVRVIPTVAQVQGLAALAVHEPSSDFEFAVTAMGLAAGHVRHGAVRTAEGEPAVAGNGATGEVLGTVMGQLAEVGRTVPEVAWAVVERLLSAGGELLTVVVGAGVDEQTAERLVAQVRAARPGVEVQVIQGGQVRDALLLGLE